MKPAEFCKSMMAIDGVHSVDIDKKPPNLCGRPASPYVVTVTGISAEGAEYSFSLTHPNADTCFNGAINLAGLLSQMPVL